MITAFAEKKKATPAQIALAWLHTRKPWIVPIPGTTKLARLEENLGGANVELTAGDLQAWNKPLRRSSLKGLVYSKFHEQLVAVSGTTRMQIRPISGFMVIAAMAFSIFAHAQSAKKISGSGAAKKENSLGLGISSASMRPGPMERPCLSRSRREC